MHIQAKYGSASRAEATQGKIYEFTKIYIEPDSVSCLRV